MKNNLITNLTDAGWKQFPTHKAQCIALYKSFQNRNECLCNEGKRKQAEIYVHEFENHWSAEIEVHGEISDDRWVKITLHGLKLTEDASYYEYQVNQTLDIWDFASSQKTCLEKADDSE